MGVVWGWGGGCGLRWGCGRGLRVGMVKNGSVIKNKFEQLNKEKKQKHKFASHDVYMNLQTGLEGSGNN